MGNSKERKDSVKKVDVQKLNNRRNAMDKITDWISQNGMIILAWALICLFLMSASRPVGWIVTIIGLILIYVMAKTQPNKVESRLNQRLSTRIDVVSAKVTTDLEQRVSPEKNLSPERKKIDERVGGMNLNLLTIFLAVITLGVVFYGPFASAYAFGINSKTSIFQTLLAVAKMNNWATLGSYLMLLVIIGSPVLVVMWTLSTRSKRKTAAFLVSLLESIVLVVVTVALIVIMNNVDEGRLLSTFSAKLVDVISMTVGFGISIYLLLISSLLTTISAALNRK